ncbi:protein kinase [bacterium]|nr:protein kinase [bacterium]
MENMIDNQFEIEASKPLDTSNLFDVYKGKDSKSGNEIIVKVLNEKLSQDKNVVQRFHEYYEQFALNVKNLKNLAKVVQFSGVAGKTVYQVQEFVDGQSLEDLVKSKKNIPYKKLVSIFEQVCEGLHALHLKKLLHYNLTPGNILVDSEYNVKITGFGSLHTVIGNSQLMQSCCSGESKTFIAPEVLTADSSDKLTGACDVYSVGKVIQTLFPDANPEILKKALEKDPSIRSVYFSKIRDFKGEIPELFQTIKPKAQEKAPEPVDDQTADPEPDQQQGGKVDVAGITAQWRLKSVYKCQAGKEISFYNNDLKAVPRHLVVKVKSGCPSSAQYNENTGKFAWTPAAGDPDCEVMFELYRKRIVNNQFTDQLDYVGKRVVHLIVVGAAQPVPDKPAGDGGKQKQPKPPKPDKPKKQKTASDDSFDFRILGKAFLWTTHLIILVVLVTAAVKLLGHNLRMGLGGVFILEVLYLMFAMNSKSFQAFLNKEE